MYGSCWGRTHPLRAPLLLTLTLHPSCGGSLSCLTARGDVQIMQSVLHVHLISVGGSVSHHTLQNRQCPSSGNYEIYKQTRGRCHFEVTQLWLEWENEVFPIGSSEVSRGGEGKHSCLKIFLRGLILGQNAVLFFF